MSSAWRASLSTATGSIFESRAENPGTLILIND